MPTSVISTASLPLGLSFGVLDSSEVPSLPRPLFGQSLLDGAPSVTKILQLCLYSSETCWFWPPSFPFPFTSCPAGCSSCDGVAFLPETVHGRSISSSFLWPRCACLPGCCGRDWSFFRVNFFVKLCELRLNSNLSTQCHYHIKTLKVLVNGLLLCSLSAESGKGRCVYMYTSFSHSDE